MSYKRTQMQAVILMFWVSFFSLRVIKKNNIQGHSLADNITVEIWRKRHDIDLFQLNFPLQTEIKKVFLQEFF